MRVEGALDLATRDRFLAEVEASLDADLLELDLRDLEYVDSTGLSAIIEANRRSEAEHRPACAPPDQGGRARARACWS